MHTTPERLRRAVDALFACAVGDCLGIPFENDPPPPAGWCGDRFEFRTPCWTDDTQQSLVLLDAFLTAGRLDPLAVMQRFVKMRDTKVGRARFGLHRGTGRGFRHAVDAFAATGRFEPRRDRVGNGAAMRVAAVAYAMGESDDARAQLEAVSRATHHPDESVDAALAVAEAAWALAAGLRGPDVVRRVIEHLPARRVRAVLAAVVDEADPIARLPEHTQCPAGDGHALGSPLAAIVLATRGQSLHAVLCDAVRLGGDTDSTAAIAGALRAGVDGLGGLPEALLKFPGAEDLKRWGEPVPPGEDARLALEGHISEIREGLRES